MWRAWGRSSSRRGCGRGEQGPCQWMRWRRKWWSQIPDFAKNTAKYKHSEDLFLPLFLSSKTEIECKLNILWRIIIQSSQHWVNQNTKYDIYSKYTKKYSIQSSFTWFKPTPRIDNRYRLKLTHSKLTSHLVMILIAPRIMMTMIIRMMVMICCNAHQGEWIFHDLDIIDCAKLAEILPQVLLLRVPGQTANKQLHWNRE